MLSQCIDICINRFIALGRRESGQLEGGRDKGHEDRGGWKKGNNEKTALTTLREIVGTDLLSYKIAAE